MLAAVLDRKLVAPGLLRLQVERKGAVLVIIELAVGGLAARTHAVQAQLARSGLASVQEAADVLPQGALTETLAGAEHLKSRTTLGELFILLQKVHPYKDTKDTGTVNKNATKEVAAATTGTLLCTFAAAEL